MPLLQQPGWQAVRRRQAPAGLAVALLLASPPLRTLLEARMASHMLLQFPLLMLAGACMAHAAPPACRQRLGAWNAHGIAGLTWAALVLALGMVPRLLDLALTHPPTEAAKFTLLLLGGAALRLSWQAAGTVVQGFFLGNTLPMMAMAGWLYGDAPVRLCNAYGLDDQQTVGLALGGAAAAVAATWLALATWGLVRQPPAQPS
jgi:hypothetical protein